MLTMNLRVGRVKPGAHWMLGLEAAQARSGQTAPLPEYGSVVLGTSVSVPDEFRTFVEKDL